MTLEDFFELTKDLPRDTILYKFVINIDTDSIEPHIITEIERINNGIIIY